MQMARPLSVRDALTMINQALDEALADQEGDFDSDTRWALTWFAAVRIRRGRRYGSCRDAGDRQGIRASRAVVEAGDCVSSGKGKVRLLRTGGTAGRTGRQNQDKRLTVWDIRSITLIRALDQGEAQAPQSLLANARKSKAEISA
jgi:putative DNA methylase